MRFLPAKNKRLFFASLVLIPLLVFAWRHWSKSGSQEQGVRVFFDIWDIQYYYRTSGWIDGGQVLFADLRSDYPLLPNLFFAAVRAISYVLRPFEHPFDNFYWVFVSLALLALCRLLFDLRDQKNWGGLLMWCTPGVFYFTAFRFDIYPAVASYVAVKYLRDRSWMRSAGWLSICIALKVYAVFLLPVLFIYLYDNTSFRRAVLYCVIAVSPFVLFSIAPYFWAGYDGMMMPFRFQATRPVSGESVYDLLEYAMRGLGVSSQIRDGFVKTMSQGTIPKIIQLSCAFIPVLFRPKKFGHLVYALLFALLGFLTGCVFYSPQFIIWIVAIACFVPNRVIVTLCTALGWVTFIQSPLAGAFRLVHQKTFKNWVIVVTTTRLLLWGVVFGRRKLTR